MEMQNTIKAIAAAGLLIPVAILANGTSDGVKITALTVDSATGNQIFITVSGPKSNKPACSADTTFAYVLPLTGGTSDALLQMILKARETGATVSLVGTGTCASGSNVETLKRMSY
jgi:hypothetical protein